MKKCLIVVDMQHDFANPAGSLYVKNGEKIIPSINYLISKFKSENPENFIIASRDWHPLNHMSFKDNGGEWPVHCVANEKGSKLVIDENNIDIIINKGKDKNKEEYSCILTDKIKDLIKSYDEIYVCGLAGDFCVKNTIDALSSLAYLRRIFFIKDLVKDVFPKNRTKLLNEMKRENIIIIESNEI